MPYDEPADLIGSCEATLDTLGLLLGDLGEEVAETPGAWTIAEILNHLLDTEQRYVGRVRRMRRELRPQMRMMPDPDYKKLSAPQGVDPVLRAEKATPQIAALAQARRMAALRHPDSDRQDVDREPVAPHGRPRRHAHGADRPGS